ncbi:hypothetical protein KFE25_012582 [Diacronema lutheri]|uniref:Uncharacterized protein n=1 Tax=Diacronema lutheri TaxID=2081491 RepID=A0A8J6CA63_DIALT|nr:hypothetical protein KFE25_012582 [Diacronema lutheri]
MWRRCARTICRATPNPPPYPPLSSELPPVKALVSVTVDQSIEDVQQLLANMTAAFARGMQVPIRYVEATVEPGSTRVRFTVSVPPPTSFQNVNVRANVLAITRQKVQAIFESAGLAEVVTTVGELSVVVPPPPSPPPKRDDDDDDDNDNDEGALASSPTPGLDQAGIIIVSTVVPAGSLIICAVAARALYIRHMRLKLDVELPQ